MRGSDQALCSVASDLGLNCLLRPIFPNVQDEFQKQNFRWTGLCDVILPLQG